MDETHYPDGQAEEGYLSVSTDWKNGQYSMPDDKWPEISPFGAEAFNEQSQCPDVILWVGPPAEQIYVNQNENFFMIMNIDFIRKQTE